MDNDFAGLADGLLTYNREQQDAHVGIDGLAEDLLAASGVGFEGDGDGASPQENLNEDQQKANETHDVLVQLQQEQDLTLLYGPPEAVQNLGDEIQIKLMNRIFAEYSRLNRQGNHKPKRVQAQDASHRAVLDYFVRSTKTISVAAAASFAGVGERQIKKSTESTAAFTLLGGTWLLGAMLSAWRQMSRAMREPTGSKGTVFDSDEV